ncbi:protein CrtK-like [Neodiprion fabricii]|uniref:protein CrtK-like n=1 Tax=Neodiprion fabricii TaxID=2872261 RepID=UPI001ED95A95|nr:protein CrtK-like [Neodiprion fabricii]
MEEKRADNVWIFLAAIVVPNLGGWVGFSFWTENEQFENRIGHPSWRFPNWIFPIVWTVMYTLMGIASYYVWKEGQDRKKLWIPFAAYTCQLIVNWFWTPLFFIWVLVLAALINIVILWVIVFATIVLFYRVTRKAALFMIPYLVWVTILIAQTSHYHYMNPEL